MALIAWNTDAPVYHWPYATVGLIGVNTAAYIATWTWDDQTLRAWSLTLGEGLHPLQWITSSFLHADIWHLLGNMFFLWAYGLVVEGKVGWVRFLPMYLGLAVTCNFIEQLTTLGVAPGGMPLLGASDVVFGLLAIAVVWAPENEIEFLFLFSFGMVVRAQNFSAAIWKVALWYVAWNLFIALLTGFQMSGTISHLVGAALGFPLAWWMLNTGRVDCEGWDLFTRLDKRRDDRRSMERAEQRRLLSEVSPPVPGTVSATSVPVVASTETGEKALNKLRKLLEEKKGSAALAVYQKVSHVDKRWKLPEADLVNLIDLLHLENRFVESIPFLEDYLERFTDQEINFRLRLARILIEQQQRPAYALRVMSPLPETPLPEALERLRARLKTRAQELIDDGVLELEGRSW